MFFRNTVKKVVTVWALLPIHRDIAKSRLCRTVTKALSGRARKLAVMVSCLAIASWSVLYDNYLLAGLLVIPVTLIPAANFRKALQERARLRRVALSNLRCEGLPPPRETLLKMGIECSVVTRVLSDPAVNFEVLIGEFDQNNRVLSQVGRIPLFDGFQAKVDDYRPRTKNRVQIVVLSGVVAIKKTYGSYERFRNEALTLSAVSDVEGVPKLIGIRIRERVLYQSFVMGQNLGSLMSQLGAPVSLQYQAAVKYPGRGNWCDDGTAPSERELVIKALHSIVDQPFVHTLGKLFEKIHHCRVAIQDVKYGNVLISDGKPVLFDFDKAECFFSEGRQFVTERDADRDKFHYFFGQELMSDKFSKANCSRSVESTNLFGSESGTHKPDRSRCRLPHPS